MRGEGLRLLRVAPQVLRQLVHAHRLLPVRRVHRLERLTPHAREVLVQHARLEVGGAIDGAEKRDDVPVAVRAVRLERELDVRVRQNLRAGATQVVEHLAALDGVAPVRVDAEQQLVREHLRLGVQIVPSLPRRRIGRPPR